MRARFRVPGGIIKALFLI